MIGGSGPVGFRPRRAVRGALLCLAASSAVACARPVGAGAQRGGPAGIPVDGVTRELLDLWT